MRNKTLYAAFLAVAMLGLAVSPASAVKYGDLDGAGHPHVVLLLMEVGGKPARLVVREYERYYTDRTIPEVRGGVTHKRRVVEERLVYTAFFNL